MKTRFFLLPAVAALVISCSGASEPKPTAPAVTQAPSAGTPGSAPPTAPAPATVPTAPAPSAPVPVVVNTLGPMESIKDLDKQVEAYHLGQNLSSEQIQENAALKQRIIRGTFDIEELCRLSLDKHWETLTPEQRAHFVELMTKLLENKAIFSKEQLRGENKYYQINYLGEKIQADDATKSVVTTKMVVPKRRMDLDLTYKMVKKESGWKIYDVVVDDASLLSNYKFQFDRIIQKGGFADLIKRMEQKLKPASPAAGGA